MWWLWPWLAAGSLVDMTPMLHMESHSPFCDAKQLAEIDCENTLWHELLEKLCRHCSEQRCVSAPELAKVAQAVMQLYVTMLGQNLESFGCKHGLMAALLFHSEHVALDFRRPSAEVEDFIPPPMVEFNLSVEEMQSEPAVVEQRLKSAGVPLALVDLSRLQIVDSDGFPVSIHRDSMGVYTLEAHRHPTEGGFPLKLRYEVPKEGQFITLRRFFFLRSEGEDRVVSIHVGIPLMSLSPFPFHTAKLRPLRVVTQGEYDAFLAEVSGSFSSMGLSHVLVDNDYTLRYWDLGARHSDEQGYLMNRFGLTPAPSTPLQRMSFFVPVEHREQTLSILRLQPHSLVDLGIGHVQLGEQPFAFASGLNFRVFCSSGLWVSVYFYATEDLGSVAAAVLPLAFWVPCRIPVAELFPALPTATGHVPRPPVAARRQALWRWQQGPDPLHAAQGRGVRITKGCRGRQELLEMHDMSRVINLSMETTLELIMGYRQVHEAPGLELYQDKIQLSQDFAARGFRVPKIYYASYEADFDVRPVLLDLERRGVAYVAKASHMCCSKAVFLMQDGVDRLSGRRLTAAQVQELLGEAYRRPFKRDEVDTRCGDWGTVEAGKRPGVLVEELFGPSFPPSLLGAEWVTPDSLSCHLLWSTLYQCRWEITVRRTHEAEPELMGLIFRDGSCLSCRAAVPVTDWPSTVRMLEALLPGTDYLRISFFVHQGLPVINEVEYTTGGLEVIPVPIAREWTLRWLEGYYFQLA